MLKQDTVRKVGTLISRQTAQARLDFDQILSFILFQTGLREPDLHAFFIPFAMALDVPLPLGGPIQTPRGTFSLVRSQRGNSSRAVNNTGPLADKKATTRAWVYRRIGPNFIDGKIPAKPTSKDVRTGELTRPFVP